MDAVQRGASSGGAPGARSAVARWRWLLGLAALLSALVPARAQDDEIDAVFRRPPPEEVQRLRALLAEPLPAEAPRAELERRVQARRVAALRLGDRQAEEAVLREAVARVPTAPVLNDLANVLQQRGESEAALALRRDALAAAPPYEQPFMRVRLAEQLFELGRRDAGARQVAEAQATVDGALAQARLPPNQRRVLLRARTAALRVLSTEAQRRGRWDEAVALAERAERAARDALAAPRTAEHPAARMRLAVDVAHTLTRKTQALRAAGRLYDAEQALRDSLRFAAEVELPARQRAALHATAGQLRFAQREFAQAARQARRALELLDTLGHAPDDDAVLGRRHDLFIALAGQDRWTDALAELRQLDASFDGAAAAQRRRIAFRFDRAYVYLGNGLHAEAAALFEQSARSRARLHGEGHFFAAQARGLQGVALWRTGEPALQRQAVPLLAAAAASLVDPRNADYLEPIGLRPTVRRWIVGAAIEALARFEPERVGDALGLADWLRAGAVQQALSDAAVRAAAATPALAALVREEQEARNEIRALRDGLEEEAGGDDAPVLPEVAGPMRERIAALEATRQSLQRRIREGFPGYDRLVRPLPPTLAQIAAQLRPDEALLVLMPEAGGVNTWAVKQADGVPQVRFHRAELPEARLQAEVDALRASLESFGRDGRLQPFDARRAHALHQVLLAPLAPFLADRPQWIVSAAGALALLPPAVLVTRPPVAGEEPAWLVREVALAQVPSVGAWLSLRTLPRRQAADQPLMAWGDPLFDPRAPAAAASAPAAPVRRLALPRAPLPEPEAATPAGVPYYAIPPLPETRSEVQALARLLGAAPADALLLGADATRDSVLRANASGMLARRRVVAFATHGLVAGDLPRLTQPALALAGTGREPEDALAPLLTLEDVLGLQLNSEWVILSACNTAAADGRAEEALSGLARGFFYAGGRSLLVTQWAVESDSARELVTRSFAHLAAQPGASKAVALREAMLQVLADRRWRHPAFWAPYVLVGESLR